MELFENKVGRPSNEIIKKRRMFIASIVLAVLVVLFAGCYALFSVGTNDLKGASYGRSYIDMSVRNSKVKVNDCKITIPVDIKNAQKKELTFVKAQIHYVGGKPLQTVKFDRTLAAKTKITKEFVFDIKNLNETTRSDYKVTLIFKVSGKSKEYYEYDLYTAGATVFNAINKCKNNGTTKKAVTGTTKATNSNGRPVATTKKTTKKTTKVTTKKPAGTTKKTTVAVKNGSTKINHYANSGDVWVTSDCKLSVQVDVENRTNSKVYITSGKLAKYANHGSTNYATVKSTETIAAGKGKKAIVKYEFPIDKLPSGVAGVSIVTYFTNEGVKYWKAESINFSKNVSSQISSCKIKTTTKKTVAQPKLSTNLKCTSSMESVGSGNISCTTVAGALVEVFGQSPVSFMKTYTADSKGKISFSVPKEGSYLVQATKSGYTSTKYTVKVTKKKVLKIKDKVTLKNGYFYSSATAKKAATKTKKSGTYYIWSATIKNNRIRITTKSGYAGKSGKITAWVNVSDLVY